MLQEFAEFAFATLDELGAQLSVGRLFAVGLVPRRVYQVVVLHFNFKGLSGTPSRQRASRGLPCDRFE